MALMSRNFDNIATEDRKSPPKGYPTDRSEYADPDVWAFPVDTKARVKSALGYFDKHDWRSAENKRRGARKILAAAKDFGIDVNKDDNVWKEAHGK